MEDDIATGTSRRGEFYEEVGNQLRHRAFGRSIVAPRRAGQLTPRCHLPPVRFIPAGSLLHVRLTCTLTSKTSKPGDPFTGIVTTPITVDGKEIIGAGSTVEGHVAFVKQSGRVSGVAQMRVVLDDIITTG